MNVTVCELPNGRDAFARAWDDLVRHARDQASELVLLPEMPFSPWLAWTRDVDPTAWATAVADHDRWLARLAELAPAAVAGSRPISRDGRRYNEAFLWSADAGLRALHTKYYLPDDDRFWEATWYDRGDGDYRVFAAGPARAGTLICTEMWFTEHARAYARAGAQILLVPRATEWWSADKWLAGGRAAAVMSGAFCLSSNRAGVDATGTHWGGHGWIVEPENAAVLALTSAERPFRTVGVDLDQADAAKKTYPRYVRE